MWGSVERDEDLGAVLKLCVLTALLSKDPYLLSAEQWGHIPVTGLTLTLLRTQGKRGPRRLSSRGPLRGGRSPQPRATARQLGGRVLAPGTAQPQLLLTGICQQMLALRNWTGAWLLQH